MKSFTRGRYRNQNRENLGSGRQSGGMSEFERRKETKEDSLEAQVSVVSVFSVIGI